MADGPHAPGRVPPELDEEPAESGAEGEVLPLTDALKARKKRDKVRAAWIAFTGRILAQLIGAVATVGLGLYVVRTYGVERLSRPPAATATAPDAAARPSSPDGTLALVVLPFEMFSSGARDAYFSDGLTEALIASLSRIADLRVVSRTSSMLYKGTSKTLPVIARELKADLVVEGAVMREADHVRVTVQLIDASSDTHLWSGTYDRPSRDLLSMQADVTRAIARELQGVISPRQDQTRARQAGIAPEALDRYLRGRQALRRRSPGDLVDATAHFARVTALAPEFVPGHAALANAWCLLALDAFGAQAAREALDKAEAAAREALRRAPANADAHLAIAVVRHRRDWDWAGAEREFRQVFELNEGHATAHQRYSIFLAEQGQHDQAKQEAARAIALDPHAASVYRTAGLVSLYARRYDDAVDAMRQSLELDPTSGVTRLLLASVLIERGRHAEAGRIAATVRDPELQDQRLSLLAAAAMRAGDRATAVRYRDELLALPGNRTLVATARLDATFGQTSALLTTAARAVEDRTQLACALKVHPVFDGVREMPDFRALMRKVGLS